MEKSITTTIAVRSPAIRVPADLDWCRDELFVLVVLLTFDKRDPIVPCIRPCP